MNKTRKIHKGLELSKWIHHYENKWLTIKDVEKFPLNKKIKLLMLDRNIYDTTDSFPQGKLYSPTTFFKKCYALYWKTSENNLSGKIKYAWQKEEDEPYDFEFHVEYKKNNWYPFTNGILPAKDNQGIFTLLNKDKQAQCILIIAEYMYRDGNGVIDKEINFTACVLEIIGILS